jgi:hypothetical protein
MVVGEMKGRGEEEMDGVNVTVLWEYIYQHDMPRAEYKRMNQICEDQACIMYSWLAELNALKDPNTHCDNTYTVIFSFQQFFIRTFLNPNISRHCR